jgi:MFS family permease
MSTMARGNALVFYLIAYVLFIGNAGANLLSALYGSYRQVWHLSAGTLTLVYALYALTLIPALPYFGRLSDRINSRSMLLGGLLCILMASVLALLAQSVTWLFWVRVLQGVGIAVLSGAASSALLRLSAGDKARSALAATLALTGGGAFGVLLGGYVAGRLCRRSFLTSSVRAFLDSPVNGGGWVRDADAGLEGCRLGA